MAQRYWVGGTGTWDSSTTTHWSATSGGAGGASVPGSSDVVNFNASSGGGTVTPNYDMTVSSIVMLAFTGTLDFSANGNSPTIGALSNSGTGVRTLNLGDGTWTLTNNGNPWDCSITTNLTFNANSSTIKLTGPGAFGLSFSGGGLTYNNLWFARGAGGDTEVTGSNTFNDFRDTGTAAHSLLFTAGTTQTVTTFTVSGSAGNVITINSNSTATHALVKTGGGIISSDYLNIRHSVATPSFTWYAGSNSVNNQGVATAGSGWIFSRPPRAFSPLPTHYNE